MAMRVPVDTKKWSFVCAGEPEQLRDYETGQLRGNPDGLPLYRVPVLAMSEDEQEVLRITVAGEPTRLVRAQPVEVVELTCRFWANNGRAGLSYQASRIAGATGTPSRSTGS